MGVEHTLALFSVACNGCGSPHCFRAMTNAACEHLAEVGWVLRVPHWYCPDCYAKLLKEEK